MWQYGISAEYDLSQKAYMQAAVMATDGYPDAVSYNLGLGVRF
jgi:hypothetical protein